MKIAIVCDYLGGIGGAERVCQYICEEFPDADVYTLGYNAKAVFPYFATRSIKSTWLSKFIQSPKRFRLSFFIATYVMQCLDLSRYDVVISASATVAKYVSVKNGRHFCYCFIPTRAIWHFDRYFTHSLIGKIFQLLLPLLRKRDYEAAQKVDHFIAISRVTQGYIKRFYDRDSVILHSPIDTGKFTTSSEKKDYHLIVSRLEHWKVLDYAIEAFNESGFPLRIIGAGEEESRLRAMAKPNITFLGEVDDACLSQQYAEARAVIFTPCLEYGLIPLEANASGTPVICYGRGGVEETMVSLEAAAVTGEYPTAVFFFEQTSEALLDAIKKCSAYSFDSQKLVRHAARWSVETFRKGLRRQIVEVCRLPELT